MAPVLTGGREEIVERELTHPLKYDIDRTELIDFVPPGAERLLDIGCGGGRYAAELALARPELEVWGVEPDSENATLARPRFHTVVEDEFPAASASLPASFFDVVTFNDVLEHLVEPSEAIAAVVPLLRPGGKIVASIPNVRHRSVIWPLLRRGAWDYEENGLLDRTHLRFFTRQSMTALFTDAGWVVHSVVGVNRRWHWGDLADRRKMRLVRRVVGHRLDDFFYVQYVVTASPPPGGVRVD